MSFHGYDPGDRNNWYQSPSIGPMGQGPPELSVAAAQYRVSPGFAPTRTAVLDGSCAQTIGTYTGFSLYSHSYTPQIPPQQYYPPSPPSQSFTQNPQFHTLISSMVDSTHSFSPIHSHMTHSVYSLPQTPNHLFYTTSQPLQHPRNFHSPCQHPPTPGEVYHHYPPTQPYCIPTNQFVPPPSTHEQPRPISDLKQVETDLQLRPIPMEPDRVRDWEVPIVDSGYSSFTPEPTVKLKGAEKPPSPPRGSGELSHKDFELHGHKDHTDAKLCEMQKSFKSSTDAFMSEFKEELRRLRASKQTPAGQVDNPLKFGSLPSSTHEIIPATIKASSSVVSSSNGTPIITSLNTGLNLSHHEVGTEPLASAISTISTAALVCSDKSEEVVSGANTSCVTSSETMVKLSRCTAPPLCNLALDIATVLRLVVTEEDHLLLDMISLVGQGEADDKPSLSLFERIINALSISCKSSTLPVDSFTFVFPIMEQTLLSSEKTELHDNVLQIIYMHMNPILPLPRLQVISVPYYVLGIVQAYQYCIGSVLNELCFGLQPDGVAPILYRVYAKVVHIRMASLTAVKCIPTVAIRFLIQKVEAATSIWIALHNPEKSVTKAVEDFWDCYGNDFGTDYLGLFKACSHVHYTVRYPAAEVLAAALDKFPDSIQESLSTLLLMYVCDASLSENNVNRGWLKVDSEMVMCSADAQSDAKLWPWFILCLQLYHWETQKSILVYREAFNQMGEMSQTTLSHNGPTLAGKDNLIGIVAIIDWFRCALSEFGTVATLNAWLNDNFLCLPLENKPEKMTLFLAGKLEKMGHKRLLTKFAAVMFVSKDGKYVALGSKDVDTFVVVIKKMEHEFIELRNHFLSQGVVNLLEEVSELAFAKFGPSVILLTGLQGIGKTTIFTTLKMAFLLCQVALTRMGKLQDERFLFSGSFSYDNYACFDIVMAKQLPNAACHSILFRLILGALRQESSEALRRWQYALLLSSFQYCQHMLNLDIPSTVLQFLLLDEQEVEDLDLQKISREQAEVAHGNFFILRKKAQSVLDLVINDSTQGCEIGEMMSLYVLDAIICVDHDGVHSQNSMQQQAQTLEAELALLLKIKYLFASFISRDEDYYACVEGREIISNLSITAASIFLLNLLVQPEHEHRKWSAAISVGLISSGLYITDLKQKFEKCLGVVKSTFKRNQSFLQLYLPYISVGKAFTGLQNEYQIDQVDVRAVIAIVIIQLHSNEATELCKGMDKLLQAFGIYTAFAYLAYHLCSVGPQLLIEQFIDVAFVGNFYDTNVDQWLPAHDERFICKGTKRISRRLLTLLQNPFANVRMGMMTPSCTSNDKLGVHEATKTDQLADKDNVSFHQWGITFVIFYFEFVYHFFLSQCCWYNILVKMLHMVDFFQDAPHAPIF